MGKINNYYYPDIDAKEAVETATHVYNFPGHTMSVQMFAEKLGLKARGGWTGMILASIKNFGLVEGRGTLTTTELGEKVINPVSESELSQAKLDMFNKIDLFNLIKADYGNRAPSSEFTGWLIEKISAERTEAQKKSKKIAKLYTGSEAFCFSPTTHVEEGRREAPIQRQNQASSQANPSSPAYSPSIDTVTYGSSEDFGIWVKKDLKAIDYLESQIESIRAWLLHQRGKLESENDE